MKQQRKYSAKDYDLDLEIIRVSGRWHVQWAITESLKSIAARNQWNRFSKEFREQDRSFRSEAFARNVILGFLKHQSKP